MDRQKNMENTKKRRNKISSEIQKKQQQNTHTQRIIWQNIVFQVVQNLRWYSWTIHVWQGMILVIFFFRL